MQTSIANNWIDHAEKLGGSQSHGRTRKCWETKGNEEIKKRAAICKSQPGRLIATFAMELDEHVLANFLAVEDQENCL